MISHSSLTEYPPVEPPSEAEMDREFARVQSLVPPPLVVPEDELPEVLIRKDWPDEFTSDPRRNL